MPKSIALVLQLALLSAPMVLGAGENYGSNDTVGHYADVNGISMYYETYGSGQPMVLIHGNGQSIAGMEHQISHFSRQYRVVVADSRGHGKSGLGEGELTYVQMAADWNALMDHLEVDAANIFGWSDGGIIGLLLAIHYPDKVGKLAVMGANLRPDETAINAFTAPVLQAMSATVDEMIATGDESNDWALLRQHLNLLMQQPNIPVEDLHTIEAPVLLINGDKDIIRNDHQLEMFNNLPMAHLAILPGETHWAPVSDPEGFNALLDRWFSTPYTRPESEQILLQEMGGEH